MLRMVVLLVAMSGCSFALVSGPPANHAQLPAFDCTTSRLGPGLDTVWTLLQVSNLALRASQSEAEYASGFANNDPPITRGTTMVINGVLAGLGIAGMYYGFSKTGECRSAKAALAARTQNNGGYPGQPGVGSWPPPQGGQGYPPPQGQGYPPPQGQGAPPPQQPDPYAPPQPQL